jgi:lysophospholipase L1-like esterase
MKWWFKFVLIFFVLIQIVLSVCLLYEIIKRKYPQVLGAISISSIDKTVNTPDTKSNLRSYYEPAISSKEVDATPWLNGKVVWTYNNDTLNDRFDYAIKKPANTYRIIALGDSFVFGDHVNTADSWPEQLENLLNASKTCILYDSYEVLNLGLRGFDIQNEVERYRLRGQKYNPDLVLWMLIPNDFEEINELMISMTTDEFSKKYDEAVRRKMLDGFFADFKNLYHGSLLFTLFQFMSIADKQQVQTWVQQRSNTYYLDSLPNIYEGTELNFESHFDGHPNELGHQMIAEHIYEYLINNNLIPCQ